MLLLLLGEAESGSMGAVPVVYHYASCKRVHAEVLSCGFLSFGH